MKPRVVLPVLFFAVGCVDPESPRVKFIYNGNATGLVYSTMRLNQSNRPEDHYMMATGARIEFLRANLNGEPWFVPVGGGGVRINWFRSQHERGGQITAWIDMDGDDTERCRAPTGAPDDPGPATRVRSTCFPEPGDPVGMTPLPPFEAIIPLIVRDPNGS